MQKLVDLVGRFSKPERTKIGIWFAQMKGWREELLTLKSNNQRVRNKLTPSNHSDVSYFVRFPYLEDAEFMRWKVFTDHSFDSGYSRAEFVRSPRLAGGATPNMALPQNDTMEGSPCVRDNQPLALSLPNPPTELDHDRQNKYLRTDPIDNKIRLIDASRRNGYITSAYDSKSGRGSQVFSGGYGLFRGYISTRLPKKGNIDKAGFASLMSPIRTLFGFTNSYNFDDYSHLIIRFRGDGRTYRLNFQQNNPWEIFANDLHQFYLHSTGGPHWQIAKIPLSKFYLSNRRYIPERQYSVTKNFVKRITFTLMDEIDGPFCLEIDSIGLFRDCYEKEKFVYEKYKK